MSLVRVICVLAVDGLCLVARTMSSMKAIGFDDLDASDRLPCSSA